jgi:hypothetical protein
MAIAWVHGIYNRAVAPFTHENERSGDYLWKEEWVKRVKKVKKVKKVKSEEWKVKSGKWTACYSTKLTLASR